MEPENMSREDNPDCDLPFRFWWYMYGDVPVDRNTWLLQVGPAQSIDIFRESIGRTFVWCR